jgi:hypothetical protein
LSRAELKKPLRKKPSYGDISHSGGVQYTRIITLHVIFLSNCHLLFFILNFSHELSMTQKVFEVSTWNFIGGFILLRRNAVRKNDNSTLYNFWVIALCYCPELISKVLEVSTWNFIGRYISLRRSAAHNNDKLPCIIFQLLPFVIFSHQYSSRFQICNHFSHQFSLSKDLLKLNYSALLHKHSFNEANKFGGGWPCEHGSCYNLFSFELITTWQLLK